MPQLKGYNFASILYPDASDWRRKIQQTHVKCLVSPLHSPDPDPFTEAERKEHYHIILMFDSQTSLRMALDTFEFIGALSRYAEILRSLPGYAKYLIHDGYPDKEQFSKDQVMCFNGADYDKATDNEEQFIIRLEEISNYILQNPDITFHKLIGYAMYNNREWFRIISMRSTLYVKTLLNSIVEEKKEEAKKAEMKNKDCC